MDRRARRITVLCLVLLALLLVAIALFWSDGGYIMVVASSLLGAILLLYIMSIPRKVVIGDTSLEIRCLVEITRIKYSDLRSIRRIEPAAMKGKTVLLGSYGFFGYYGYYIDTRNWETLVLYCKRWDDFIEITDAYEKRYIISSPVPDEVIEAATRAMRFYSDSQDMEE